MTFIIAKFVSVRWFLLLLQDNQLYEEIREETFPPPVEMSTVYTTATHPQPDGVESSDD